MKTTISAVLAATLVTMPMQAGLEPAPTPKNDTWLGMCVLVCAGLAVGAVYVMSKRCQPKYYWLMDDDTPPKFWVATCTKKQAQCEGWKRIGGPYNRVEDAPAVHPSPTNTVQELAAEVMKFTVQTSQDGTNWMTVDTQVVDWEDHIYYPTNSGMFRIQMGLP